jgi:threonine dehydrogenase-like Zn-dependent dehydrogenase
MTNLTKVAIFGAGRWGTHLIRNFHQHPEAEVVAIADPNPERLNAIQTRLPLPSEVRLETDWQKRLHLTRIRCCRCCHACFYPLQDYFGGATRGLSCVGGKTVNIKVIRISSLV